MKKLFKFVESVLQKEKIAAKYIKTFQHKTLFPVFFAFNEGKDLVYVVYMNKDKTWNLIRDKELLIKSYMGYKQFIKTLHIRYEELTATL